MMSRGQVVGVVEALNKPGGFDDKDTRLLSALAGLAASVVENAHLFNSVRAAETRYQALFQKSADAVWVTDVKGEILQVNQKAAELTGHTDKELPGTLLWSLTLPEERDKWHHALNQAVDRQEPTLESWIIGANDALRPLELRLKWIRAAESDRVQWIGRDISARRELEQLRQDLMHMIVHDLRSPMGTVSNSLELLKERADENEPQQANQLISIASRATQRLSNLVDSLLDISRLEAGQELTDRTPVSIQPLIKNAVEQLALYVQGKHMALNTRVSEQLPVIMADSAMIERVLVNLIGNALKFTPSGGEITVSAEADKEVLWVRVRDNGPGIAPQHQRWIFDKFARVRGQGSGKGIGLGLAFCRLAVEAHGGRIWVESTLGEGATFVFTIPLGQPLPTGKD
jgi:PAS domain S-box-containing protein